MKSPTKTPPKTGKDDKVIIDGEQYTHSETIEYSCNFCNQTLVKIRSTGGGDTELFCRNCSIPYDPEDESIRHKQTLYIPPQNTEPLVAYTPSVGADDVAIRHNVPLRGGFARSGKEGYHSLQRLSYN